MQPAVSTNETERQLTLREAANLLAASRSRLEQLLEQGQIPFTGIGSRRRVRLVDVLAYRDREEARCHEALDNLARMSQDFGLYDDEDV